MPADGVLAEALSRIEHKMDLLLELFAALSGPGKSGTFMLTPVGSNAHNCPVCTKPVSYQVNLLQGGVIARKCGCSTGKQSPIDLSLFAPPTQPVRKEEPDDDFEEQQDREHRTGRPRVK